MGYFHLKAVVSKCRNNYIEFECKVMAPVLHLSWQGFSFTFKTLLSDLRILCPSTATDIIWRATMTREPFDECP